MITPAPTLQDPAFKQAGFFNFKPILLESSLFAPEVHPYTMGVLITAILAGIIVGPLMAWLFDRLDHVLWNIFYALLGALVLRIILYFIFPHRVGAGFTAAGVVAALLGAVLATYVTKFVPPIKEMGGSTEEDVHYSEEDAEDEAEEEEKEEKSESE